MFIFDAFRGKKKGLKHTLAIGSVWDFECWRKGQIAWKEKIHNLMTDEGINSLLNVYFHAATQITQWYVTIFEDNYTPLVTNTYAVPGYTETTAYSEATRPTFDEAAASGKAITNTASKATFTFSSDKTIYGGALVGGGSAAGTKSDKAGGGVLVCSAKFATSKPVVTNDVLKVTVTISGQDL